jgi:glyoxylase-like metal-dependent hydrolase (beta-lactamase superfamily II)
MPLISSSFALGPFATNAYLITCRETRETAIVDVGFEVERIVQAVRQLGLQIRYLLNTHAHYDHAAGMRELQEQVGGDYWLHPDDRFLLEGLAAQGAAFGLPAPRAPEVVHDLAEGQSLTLGQEALAVIHTPGHSPGSVTFHWSDRLWVGDVLFAGSIGRTDLPGGSFEVLEHSIRKRLFPLGDHMHVLPGHGPATTLGEERRTNPWVGERANFA